MSPDKIVKIDDALSRGEVELDVEKPKDELQGAREHTGSQPVVESESGQQQLGSVHQGEHVNLIAGAIPSGGISALAESAFSTEHPVDTSATLLGITYPESSFASAVAKAFTPILPAALSPADPSPVMTSVPLAASNVASALYATANPYVAKGIFTTDPIALAPNIVNEIAAIAASKEAEPTRDGEITLVGDAGALTSDTIGVIDNAEPLLLAPTITVINTTGTESEAIPLAIHVNSNSLNVDDEMITVTLSGMPDGASLSAGINNGDGSWTLSLEELSNLTLSPPIGIEDYVLQINATSTTNGDSASANPATFTLDVTAGGDTITGTAGKDTLTGTIYSDTISSLGNDDTINAGTGDDTVSGGSGNDTIHGDAGKDTIHADEGNDAIYGDTGKDVLYGDAGNDDLYGGDAEDILYGGEGRDTLEGEGGDDTLYGDTEDDNLSGGEGSDTLHGGAGKDVLHGDAGSDVLRGEAGDDTLFGDEDEDVLYGGEGEDVLRGGVGNDTLYGDAHDDTLLGEEGDDILYGGEGSDTLRGGTGDDTIESGPGDDQAQGNAGNDVFLFGTGDGSDSFAGGTGAWTDTIHLEDVNQGPTATADTPGSWVLETNKSYSLDLDNKTITFDQNNASGTITLADGSELSFSQVEKIEW